MMKPQPKAAPSARRMTLGAVRAGKLEEPLRVLIYGVGGVGKSTFASEMPRPIFLDTQDGSARLDVERFPRPESWSDVLAAVDELATASHDYQTLAIDLVDDVQALIWSHICERDKQENIESYGYGKGYKVALSEWRILLSKLERLRTRGMHVVMVAHAQIRPYKNPEGEDFDRYSLGIHDGASGLVRGWCDTVLFARHEVLTHTDKQRKRTRGISTGARVVHTVETAAYDAKNRHGLPDTLPLDWAAFAEALRSGAPASADDLRNEIAELAARAPDELRALVEQTVRAAPNDVARLVRVLNRLRERVQTEQTKEVQS